MKFEELVRYIKEKQPELDIKIVEDYSLQPSIEVSIRSLVPLIQFIKIDDNLFFDHLSCISSVDEREKNERFLLVYHFYSLTKELSLIIKVPLTEKDEHTTYKEEKIPLAPSISHLFKTADWHEREAFDMMGIWFEGHPDMRRILLPDDWEGWPLRKDYKEQESYRGMKVEFEKE